MRNGFYPFAIVGFPFSQIGGAVQLPKHLYYPLGVILCWSMITGAVIGFVSGTTGTGGGIFLAPVILSIN